MVGDKKLINEAVKEFGEQYRQLFTDALKWLDEKEPEWKLDLPIDREEFLADLTYRARKR